VAQLSFSNLDSNDAAQTADLEVVKWATSISDEGQKAEAKAVIELTHGERFQAKLGLAASLFCGDFRHVQLGIHEQREF
jgi:hypothetical protein